MPKDRRVLRSALQKKRELQGRKRLLGFDFDCTLTCHHFYKVMVWGYGGSNLRAHPHCRAFVEWCKEHEIDNQMQDDSLQSEEQDPMMAALDVFCQDVGEKVFGEVFREVFLGGDVRIALVAQTLQKLQAAGVEFAIITRGTSCSVLRALVAVPEWLPFFPASCVWDNNQSRHRVSGANAQKTLMLRDLCPTATRILLVDDSLAEDPVPEWVLKAAGVEVMALPYEGPGVTEGMLKQIEEIMLRE